MKKLATLLFILLSLHSLSQYKNDNVAFKTVFTSDLCDSLAKYPDRLILDVRSAAEFNEKGEPGKSRPDMGRFKNAINIDVRELDNKLTQIEGFKNKTVFVICSHSQRSRRASALLAKNGFENIININGGMTSLHQLTRQGNECIYNQIITTVKYDLISSGEFCKAMTSSVPPLILDVRMDTVDRLSMVILKSFGNFKNTVHIPINELADRINEIPSGRKIIITDISGNETSRAADLLVSKNFTNIAVLSGGVEQFIVSDPKLVTCKNELYIPSVPFRIIGSEEMNDLFSTLKDPLFLDIRNKDEFNNKAKDNSRNIGHILNATNIPFDDLSFQMSMLDRYKNKPVIIYGFSQGREVYAAAQTLSEQGFKNIYVLSRGLFNLRWTAHNLQGYQSLSKMIIDVPEENL